MLGDDLALNAQQVSGVKADRELLAHRFLHSDAEAVAHHAREIQAMSDAVVDVVAFEKEKIKGAVRTDFILSAEIIVISLGTVADAPFGQRLAVLCAIAVIMTVGVYGLVGGIVKLDDVGLYLSRQSSAGFRWPGQGLLRLAPWLMKALSLAGTVAMFLVGGGILMHGIPGMHHMLDAVALAAAGLPVIGGVLSVLVPLTLDGIAGILGGALVLAAVTMVKAGMRALRPSAR